MVQGQALTFEHPAHGEESVARVLKLQHFDTPLVQDGQVLVQMLAAPINPLDIHVLRGAYPVKARFQVGSASIAGFDGVGKVIGCGEDVKGLSVGDTVIPKGYGLGTWRTHAVIDASQLLKIKPPTQMAFAAILKTVVLPAFLLVEDMKMLQPGDWVVQNAGSSAISQMVSQMVRIKGGHTISILRDRPETEASRIVKAAIQNVADVVLEERQVSTSAVAKDRNVVLALDSVWGSSARQVVDLLSVGGLFVNYGQFSGIGKSSSISLTHEDLFWKSITFRSFRSTTQSAKRTEDELIQLLVSFVELFNSGLLTLPKLNVIEWDPTNPDVQTKLPKVVGDAESQAINTGKTVLLFGPS
ncbi:MAG: hypothetical protein Q9192_002722 [Flavoplaca navasiana]